MAVVVPYVVSFLVKAAVSLAVSAVTSWLFAPSIKGPRLSDRNATGQGYGSPIPRVYGIAKVQASVLWASPLIEKKHEEGGKGGPSVTTYTYSQHVALAVCEGEAQPLRIWAGGKLIWDAATAKSDKKVIRYNNVATYTGSETQAANSLIQSYMGAANTPAYRGTCYVVLQNLQLEKFGNRLPPFEVEVSSRNAYGYTVDDLGDFGTTRGTVADATYNSARDKFVTVDGNTTFGVFRFYETDLLAGTTTEVAQYATGATAPYQDTENAGIVYVSSTNELWVSTTWDIGTVPTQSRVWIFDADTYAYKTALTQASYSWLTRYYRKIDYDADTDTVFISRTNLGSTTYALNATSRAVTDNFSTGDYVTKMISTGEVWSAGPSVMLMLTLSGLEVHGIAANGTHSLLATHAVSGGDDFAWDSTRYRAAWVNGSDTNLYYVDFPRIDLPMWGQKYYIGWLSGVSGSVAHGGNNVAPSNGVLDEIVYVPLADVYVATAHGIGTDFTAHVLDGETGLAIDSFAVSGPTNTGCLMPWPEDGGSVVYFDTAGTHNAYRIPFQDYYYGLPARLDVVVADILARAGLSSAEYDVTDLAATWVDGYVIARPMSARDALEPLRAAYWFDAAESGGKIKCKMRGSDAVATIPEDDLAASNDNEPDAKPFIVTRGTEEELPEQVDVHYWRKNNEYEVAVQHDKVQNTESTQLASIELPVVLDDFKARDVASVSLYTTRLERTQYQFKTGRKYTNLEPMDIVNVTYDGDSYRIRITEKDEGGGIIIWKGVPDDQSLYTTIGDRGVTSGFYTATDSTVGGSVGNTDTGNDVATPEIAPTYARYLDLPPLLATHAGLGIYVSVTPNRTASTDDWEGAVNYYSLDGGSSFALGTAFGVETVVGQAEGTLGNHANWTLIDYVNTLAIEISGTLSSTTWDGLIAGQNAMLVGSEIIQFQTATLLGLASNGINRRYRISKLLRGRRGTESYIGTHAASEICVLLDSRVARLVEPETRLGSTVYRVGTIGEDVDDLANQTVSNTGVCLKPWAPVNLRAKKSTAASWDINLTWNRRDRLHGDTMLWAAQVPMSEAAEEYEIEIYTSDFATLKRTVTGLTSAAYTYSNADQVTDFGSTQSAIGLKVYQISATVGRGFAASQALTVY